MAKGTKVDVVTITETQQRALEERIVSIKKNMENSVFDMTPLVRELSEGKAHIRDGYSNFKEYVVDKLGIGASSAMNMIALSKRYSEGGNYAIPDRWKEYGFAKLQILAKHTNTEISEKGITPEWKVSEIIAAFKPAIEESAESAESAESVESAESAESNQVVTINYTSIMDALKGGKKKADELAKWIDMQKENGVQSISILLGE